MKTRHVILALALSGGVAACAGRLDAPLSTSFGRAVASMDSQIIDPRPAEGVPETSAVKAAGAIANYENDRVTEPPGSYGEKVMGNIVNNQGAGAPDNKK